MPPHPGNVALEILPRSETGAGWTILAGTADSPFGTILAGISPRGICHLSFAPSADRAEAERELLALWPGASLRWDPAQARCLAERIFGDAPDEPIRAVVRATAFQEAIWRTLLRVPRGQLVTYSALAAACGRPGAARAAGNAVAANPLAYLIPCHRVIRETGEIGGYRWSPAKKRLLLAAEAAPQPPPPA